MKRVVSFGATMPLSALLVLPNSIYALQNLFSPPKLPSFPGLISGGNTPAPLQKRIQLGTLSVSPMGLGTLNLPINKEIDDETTQVLKTASELGINFADTAEAYGFGKSETMTRNCLRDANLEVGDNGMNIATKFAPVPWRPDGSSVVEACKASAERLGVEKIPLYQIHWPDIIQPFKSFGYENRKDELFWDGLAECYLSGLVENVGVSNYGPETLLRASDALSKRGVPITSNQINLSLARYRSSEATLKICDELGIKVLAYFPLANGLLAGKYSVETPPSWPKSITMKKYYEGTAPILNALKDIAEKRQKTVPQVAINWTMMKGAIPIPGARNVDMARDNFGAMGWALTEDEVFQLEAASAAS
eukprot:CAMPEP_0196148396 /NCGR_PEP_ID=MMETSP0910-20130528/27637_1 /TAXON_ID=49265 /ORGANISM="Thalassiosira rotula, Strain GSO102" /LENGTH=363 /DNA_ID=CAMNT_0041411087 /DNA_START=95 /DNA_END=1183 /DNA_ORIENTATION=+